MTREFVRKVQILSFVVVFVATVALLATFVALAQQTNVGQAPAKPSAAFVTPEGGAPLQTWQRLATGTLTSRNVPASRSQSKKAVAADPGGVSFLPVVTYETGGNEPSSIAIADFNGDGKPDLAVLNDCISTNDCSTGTVAILLGNGDGTFQPAVLTNVGQGVGEFNNLAVADVNADGKPDLIVVTCCESNGDFEAAVLLGNGDGTFQPAVTYDGGGTQFSSVAVGDLNGDGRPDIVMVNWDDSNNSAANVLLGKGDGTFQPGPISAVPDDPGCATLADVNHDGKLDLLVCSEDSVGVMLGNGNGSFQPFTNTNFFTGFCTSSVAVADVNGDGLPDMVAPNAGGDGCGSEGFAGILLGNGDGSFQTEANYLALGDTHIGVGPAAVSDVNGDGKPDVMVVTGLGLYGSVHGSVGVLLGNGDGTFQAPTSFDTGGPQTNFVIAADLNGDGKPDVVVANFGSGTVGVLLNSTGFTQTPTSTTLASSLNPSTYGQTVTFTAAVKSASGTPTGTVRFTDTSTSTTLGSVALVSGNASISISSLAAGSHSITAAYQGSSSFAASTSAALNQVVEGTATSTSLVSSLNPSIFGESVTFTAAVSSKSGTPTGTVIFYEGSTAIGIGALTAGSVGLSVSSLAAGSLSITAAYQGSGAFASSTSSALNQVVKTATATTTLVSSENPARVKQSVTYTATVSSEFGGAATGTVTFEDGSVTIATVALSGSQAAYRTSYATAGTHSITATYSGDTNNAGSGSSVLTEQIEGAEQKYATTTALAGSPNPAVYGQAVTYTATVISIGPNTPTGLVKFTGLGEATLVGGVATYTKKGITAGTHSVTAEYEGDRQSAPSTSSVLEETVNKASTTTVITSSANPSSSGLSVTFTATVTSSTGLDPFGTVTFTAGSTTLDTVEVTDTVASISTATLPDGSTKITATYSGAAGFIGSSASLTQKVNP